MKPKFILITLCLALSLTFSFSCSSKEEKLCDHLINEAKVDDGKYSEEECKKDIEKLKEKCSNSGDIMGCALDAKDEKAAGDCWDKCKKKEKK